MSDNYLKTKLLPPANNIARDVDYNSHGQLKFFKKLQYCKKNALNKCVALKVIKTVFSPSYLKAFYAQLVTLFL